mmetsp:Transcript_2976/g.6194  ORF Transcript_2976/g.6194 Transcript_2976/m.6194 type:complete len:356 (-) Transcript_2976:14-1081(-)
MRLSLSCTTVFLLIYVACGGMPTEKQKAMGGKERAEEARMRAKKHQEESRERAMKRREEIQEKQKQARERGRTEAQVGDFVKHCEAQKSIAMLSWQKAFSELSDQMTAEDKKQEVLLGAQGQMALQKLFRPPTLHTMGYVRAGHLPKEIRQLLLSHLNKHRSRSFVEAFNPLLGNQRKAKALPLLPEWTKKGGFIDNLLRPILEKASGRTMELVRVGASLRIYEEGASLMQHVDSPETPITVAMPLEANGAGSSWHLQIGDPQGRKQRPVPLQPGQLLIYEGARLAHGRAGQLPHGDLTMAFAYYRPKENYEAKRIQRTLDQLLASHNAAQRGPSKPPPPKPQKKTKEFRKMDEL